MPVNAKCPMCRSVIPGQFEYGAPAVCDRCGEEFNVPHRPADEPAPPAPTAGPVLELPEEEPAAGVDSGPEPERPRRPPERAARPKHPPRAPARDEAPRDRGERAARPRRRAEPSAAPAVFIIGGVLGAMLFVLLAAGGGVWYLTKVARQARAEREARLLEEESRADEARRRAGLQRPWPEGAPVLPPDNPPPAFNPAIPPFRTEPPEPAGPPLPPFDAPVNPYKPGTQTKLRAWHAVDLPKLPAPAKVDSPWQQSVNEYTRLVFAPKHELLFALSPKGVWVYDVKAGKEIGTRRAEQTFTDLSLAPDQSVLFVADYGGERIGYGDPTNPSRVHRFDLASRKWEARKAPKIAFRAEAVDATRVLLLERDQWVSVTLNKWEEDGVGVRELSRIGSDYSGDMEYDPRTGRIYHGNSGISSPQISVRTVEGDKLKGAGDTGMYGSASTGGGGGTVVLSQDGSRLYYGLLQVGTDDVRKNLQKMQGLVYAASRDVAFSDAAYYRVTTGSKLGEFEFKTTNRDAHNHWFAPPPVISVSPDGLSVWVLDRDKNVARQFALEGDR